MMDESDDDFKELCASFFQRMKKNGTKEVCGERKTQKASNSTQRRNTLKRTKTAATKSKTPHSPGERKAGSGSQVSRTKKPGAPKRQRQESAPAPSEHREGSPAAELQESTRHTQTEAAPASNSQPPPSCLTVSVPSPSKPRTAELVLQRMQQFKRADPERLQHASGGCSPKAALEEKVPKGPQDEMVAGNGPEPALPATESDAAVALALQQELGQERASAHDDSLEEKGLFFCQICQKNLSAMNATRREQHVNRCLDEAEEALRPVAQIPGCPVCGKPFLTLKSRISHLKQCAVKMEIGPQLLLQAVRLQAAQLEGACSPPVSSFSGRAGGLKRKGAAARGEPQKKRKVSKAEVPSEDLLVAMALSRSEMEQEAVPAVHRLGSAVPERSLPGAGRRGPGRGLQVTAAGPQRVDGAITDRFAFVISRKEESQEESPRLPTPADAETTRRQIEDRVAQLLAEEAELSSTPPLPPSRILKEQLEKASWCRPPPEGTQNFLWEGSSLTGAWAPESFYTAGLAPPVVPRPPPKHLTQVSTLPPVLPDQPELGMRTPPAPLSAHPADYMSPSASQREHQALQDLVDLAGEGLSASPWPCSGDPAGSGGATGMGLSSGGLPPTGFVLPPTEKHLERDSQASLTLGLLLADFKAMVNNPHMSDIQIQTDSGDVLYAHTFVLYARCPLLFQYVSSEGFSAAEDSGPRTLRVLLSDVSLGTARAFLHYLYTADSGLSPELAPGLSALAHRFGMSELALLCEQAPVLMDSEGGGWQEENEDHESRAETFQELLRSMWRDEEEEAETLSRCEGAEEDREKVNEAEMEEIYEFAATQRKLLQEERAPEVEGETSQLEEEGPVSGHILALVKEQLENAEQTDLSGEGSGKAPAKWEDMSRSTALLLEGQGSGLEERVGPPREALAPLSCSSSSPARSCQAGRKGGAFLYSADFSDDGQPSTQYPEPSQIMHDPEEENSPVRGRGLESAHLPPHQRAPTSHLSLSRSQPPQGRSPGRPHPCPQHTSDPAPLTPKSQGRASRVASQSSPLKQKRGRSLLTLLEDPDCQRGKEYCSMLACRSPGVLISPEKSLSFGLAQSEPGRWSSRSQNYPSSGSKEEIILLLDSDEEPEPQPTKTTPAFNSPPGERKVLEMSPKSSELFSVIDVDADQEPSQSPPRREAALQWEFEGPSGRQGPVGGRGTPPLFCDPESSPSEDSTTDTSWLVPATPLGSRSRDCSSQTRITGLGSRASEGQMAHLKPRVLLESRDRPEAMNKLSVIMPQALPPCLVPIPPGSPKSTDPSSPHPRHRQRFSPQAPCPISGGLANFTRTFQKHSPPGPSLLNPATASEVVEVEDSEDEQEAASRQANSSPRRDSDPPVPADKCWYTEPLSPIPIDHLNLEWTGPLSTSSPGSRAGEAPGSADHHSPVLLGITPIRGSCTGQRKSQEKSSWASSPGSSRPSFLNSALWDDWDAEEQKPPEVLPAAQAPKSEGPGTPKGANQRNLPPKVPITPMPRYSIMETPILKKELDRFGVRPLPKRQMVLKLKEIFQYTHQTLESDSEDESQSSQVPLGTPRSQTHAIKTSEASGTAGQVQLEATSGPIPQRSKGPAKTKGPLHRKQQSGGSTPPLGMSPAEVVRPGPDGDTELPASQESTASSLDSSDSSFSSQSFSGEFGGAFESAGDGEGEEAVAGAPQAAVQAAATEEAVWRYIRSTPALYRKVLLYQPFELAELQAELKQHGIRVAMGKLLDFLDAHCITFTSAAARKEKLEGKRRQPVGRKKRVRTNRPVPASLSPAFSSL
ncbi:hypothetical protein MC885_009869 [Smutsia gigantea]|nr:hypothetical protein MC885_009869 [Smutsia gigantea]